MPQVVHIGAVPKESTEQTQEYFAPFQKYLQEKTGLQVQILVPTDYTAVVEAMAAGKIDVAYFGCPHSWRAAWMMGPPQLVGVDAFIVQPAAETTHRARPLECALD